MKTFKKLTKKEHIARHKKLHESFDELLADFVWNTNGLPHNTGLGEFLEWSYRQTIEPVNNKPHYYKQKN